MYVLLIMTTLAAAAPQAPAEFQYNVVWSKALQKDEPGRLLINESGITYRSDSGRSAVTVPFRDIHEIDLSNPEAVRVKTYDMLKKKLSGRRTYVFRQRLTRSVDENERLIAFVSERVRRPVIGSGPVTAKPEFEIPAYHRHVLNGCNGTLQIGPDGIRFESDKYDHSRTWKYSEIQTFGGADPFSFRVTTLAETFAFDLKERLPQQAYELVWQRVYDLPPRYRTGNVQTADQRKP